MKTIIFLLAALLFVGVQTSSAQSSTELSVKFGKHKRDAKSKLSVKFLAVVEDSRCPEGVNCVWAGNARVDLKVRRSNGAWKAVELNTGMGAQSVTFEGYELKLNSLTPSPKAGVPMDRRRYVIKVSIKKL
ncbi:MAG: hypothetical protein IPN69_05380 [Acidobacteria bacterium]|nr:hypothetical protein [Acidobacteriota bacterium]